MNKLIAFIKRNTTGKKVLILFILTNVVYTFMLTVTIPKTMAFSNHMKLLDMMPMGYDLDYVTKLFDALGEMGRETYLTNQIPVDMIYPVLFGFTYCFIIGYFLNKLNKLQAPYSYLCLLPLLAGISDYLENYGIVTMLKNYPDIPNLLVSLTNGFTIIKSITTTLFFIALIIILITLGFKILSKTQS